MPFESATYGRWLFPDPRSGDHWWLRCVASRDYSLVVFDR